MKIANVINNKSLNEQDTEVDTRNPVDKFSDTYHLPSITLSGVAALLLLPKTMAITKKVLLRCIPGLGAIIQTGTTWDLATQGKWSDAFVSAGLTALNIGQVFGYALGGVPGAAATVAEIAGQLYIYRIELIRLYYQEVEGMDVSQVPDAELESAAAELVKQMANKLAIDIGNGILDAIGLGGESGDSSDSVPDVQSTTTPVVPSPAADKDKTIAPTPAVAKATQPAVAVAPVPTVAKAAAVAPTMVQPNYDNLSFRKAFASARAAAKQIDPENPGSFSFTWKGKPYQTNVKGERFIPQSKQRKLLVPQPTNELAEGRFDGVVDDAASIAANIWKRIGKAVKGADDAGDVAGTAAKGADEVGDAIGANVKALPTEHIIDDIKYTYDAKTGKWVDPTRIATGGRGFAQVPEASLPGRELYKIRSPKIDAAAKAADDAATAIASTKKITPEIRELLRKTPVNQWTVKQLAERGLTSADVPWLEAARIVGLGDVTATVAETAASTWFKTVVSVTKIPVAAAKFATKNLTVILIYSIEPFFEAVHQIAQLDKSDPNYDRRRREIWAACVAKIGIDVAVALVAGAVAGKLLQAIGVTGKAQWIATLLKFIASTGAGIFAISKINPEIDWTVDTLSDKLFGPLPRGPVAGSTAPDGTTGSENVPQYGNINNSPLYKKAYDWAIKSGFKPGGADLLAQQVVKQGPDGSLAKQLSTTNESVVLAWLYKQLNESTNARRTVNIHNTIKSILAENANADKIERFAFALLESGIFKEDVDNDNFMTNVTAAIAANTKGDKVGAQKALDAAKLNNPATGTDQTNQKKMLDQLAKANPSLSVPSTNPNSTQNQTPNPNATQSNVEEAGAFSYGKKPRKGTVAYNAAEQRKRAEKNEKPIEPKDQMVGTAKVKKDKVEEAGGIGGGMSGGAIHGQTVGANAAEVIQAYNEFAAQYPVAKFLLDIMPVTGAATSVIDASQDLHNGKYGQAALDMLGALPGFKIGKYLSRGLQGAVKLINKGAKAGNIGNATSNLIGNTIQSASESIAPKMGDSIMLELADGRVIVAPISELRGNSMIVTLDETAHQWLDESPGHDALKIGDGTQSISSTAQFWNSMIDTLTHDTPAGWAQLFVNLQNTTGHVARTMPHQWANIWRQQHIALGDEITRGDMMTWVNEVESAIDHSGLEESSLNPAGGSKLRKMLDSKDPAMLAVWMSSRAGNKGISVAKFAKDKAVQSGLPANHWWGKIKNLVNETTDPYSMEKRYYIVRKTSSAAPADGVSGFHRKSEADKKLATMKNPDQYMVRAIDSTKLPKDEMTESRHGGDINFSPEDIAVIAGMTDIEDAKKHAIRLITRNSRRPMTAEKIKWFTHHINNSKSVKALSKMMYDMLLSGEGLSVIGTVGGMNPNSYRQTFKEDDDDDYEDDQDDQEYEEQMYREQALSYMLGLYDALSRHNISQVITSLDKLGKHCYETGIYLPLVENKAYIGDRRKLDRIGGLLENNRSDIIYGLLELIKQRGEIHSIANIISMLDYYGNNWTELELIDLLDAPSKNDAIRSLLAAYKDGIDTGTFNKIIDIFKQFGYNWPELDVLQKSATNTGEELDEAEYKGKSVPLSKPIRTSPSEGGKFKVYVKDPKTGNIKMVRFGDTTGLSIKRDDPKRRKNYRARHHCENPGPRTKANYWSCKFWASTPVSKLLKGK